MTFKKIFNRTSIILYEHISLFLQYGINPQINSTLPPETAIYRNIIL